MMQFQKDPLLFNVFQWVYWQVNVMNGNGYIDRWIFDVWQQKLKWQSIINITILYGRAKINNSDSTFFVWEVTAICLCTSVTSDIDTFGAKKSLMRYDTAFIVYIHHLDVILLEASLHEKFSF